MPKHLAASDKGDLLIEYGVILPMSLTEQQKQGALGRWGSGELGTPSSITVS